jgi:predicted nucleic acid-binding protein
MTVVSNTSPLRYLVAAGQAELLARLFGTIYIPPAVEREIRDPHAPPSVQDWIAQRPPWLQVRHVLTAPAGELTGQLDPGEAEAIQLAQELRADALIMDERRGRQMAAERGITVIGVLGILRESYRRAFIDSPLALAAQLRSLGFRTSRALTRHYEEQIRDFERQKLPGNSGSQA